MHLIIYCHPSKHSRHCAKILKHVVATLEEKKRAYEVLDLYRKDFNAYFSPAEYDHMIHRERVTEPDVKAIQEKILAAKTLIFIYPTWWYNMPARLKGFLDRCFGAGFAYKFKKVGQLAMLCAWLLSWIPGLRYLAQPHSVEGLLKKKKALIFRTYGGPKLGKRIYGNIPAALENAILRFCGITNITVHELFNTDKSSYTQSYEDNYMKKVEQLIKGH